MSTPDTQPSKTPLTDDKNNSLRSAGHDSIHCYSVMHAHARDLEVKLNSARVSVEILRATLEKRDKETELPPASVVRSLTIQGLLDRVARTEAERDTLRAQLTEAEARNAD